MSAVEVYQPAPMLDRHTDSWVAVVESVALLAKQVADTELVPKALRGRPAAVAAVMLYGREVGLPPMTALRSVNLINGRVALNAETKRALVLAAGHEIEFPESDGARCTARGRRSGSETWHVVTWTTGDVKRAKLSNPTYDTFPRQMLKARASDELCRDVFADIVGGFDTTELLDDNEPEPAPSTIRVSRVRPTPPVEPVNPAEGEVPPDVVGTPPAAVAGPATPSAGLGVRARPPLPGEAIETGPSEAAAAPEPEPGPTGTPEPPAHVYGDPEPPKTFGLSTAQSRKMHTLFTKAGLTERGDRMALTSALVGRPDLRSSADLSQEEASLLIDTLEAALRDDNAADRIEGLRMLAGLTVNVPMINTNGDPEV